MPLSIHNVAASSPDAELIPPYEYKLSRRGSRISYPSRPAIRAFVVFLGILTCCLVYGRLYFYRDPLSIFFDESRAFTRWYSAHRQQQADSFIERVARLKAEGHDLNKEVLPKGGANASVCATFLTVARKGVDKQYLDASIGSFLDRLTPNERQDINLQVFFANVDPASHPSWHAPWLRDLVDEVYTYANLTSEIQQKAQELERAGDAFKKSPWDYAIPLQYCYNTGSPYIAMFEDDILLAEGWFAKSILALKEMQARMAKQDRVGKWIYLRLFNQERSTGWTSRKIGGNNELIISAAVGTAVWTVLRILRQKVPSSRQHVDGWTMFVVCCVAIPSFVVLFFQAGKASLVPPAPGLHEEFYGCCAQGLIYNRDHIPGLAWLLQLQDRPEGQDLITVDYAAYYKLARWSLYPMSAQHVGVQTTIQKDKKESQAVWSMAFENVEPKRLCQEHRNNVHDLYGIWLPACA